MPDKEKSCNHGGALIGELCLGCFTKEWDDKIKAQAAVIESLERELLHNLITLHGYMGLAERIKDQSLVQIRITALKEKYGNSETWSYGMCKLRGNSG